MLAVAAAAASFVLVGMPSGVIEMIDPDYCVVHPARPSSSVSHEENLSFFPPGPVCTFMTNDGRATNVGPGWWPALALGGAVVAGIGAYRWSR